jgi:serine/threonine-protein kinase
MGTVHLGQMRGEAGFSRVVAIKRLLPAWAQDAKLAEMFVNEARIASRVHHANVVQTLDVLVEGSETFLVFEFVRGETLAKLLRQVPSCRKPSRLSSPRRSRA